MNWIFLVLIVGAVLVGAWSGTMHAVNDAAIEQAKTAVTLSISLIGQMALWLGFFGVLKEAGALRSVSNALKPIMTRLFPEVPPDHPAMGAIIMNLSANMLGLANAATPFGLKAMVELNKLNSRPGVATNSMALFLAINNSGVALLQLGVVAVRSIVGSHDSAGILVPSFLGALIHTTVAVGAAKWLQGRSAFAAEKYEVDPTAVTKEVDTAKLAEAEAVAKVVPAATGPRLWIVVSAAACLAGALITHYQRELAAPVIAKVSLSSFTNEKQRPLSVGTVLDAQPSGKATVTRIEGDRVTIDAPEATAVLLPPPTLFLVTRSVLSDWVLPGLMFVILLIAMGRKVKVYEAFIPAAKEGFATGVMIIPYLVAILVAVGMFRASGALEAITSAIGPFVSKVGFPAEALPMALVRPLSGTGALAVMTDTMKAHGPDSFIGYLVSMLNGSSETTFYVLSVYFGAVGVKAVRHTMIACLMTDAAGVVISTTMCHLFFG